MTTITSRTPRRENLGRWGLVGSTTLILLVIGVAAVWLVRPHDRAPAAGESTIQTRGSTSEGTAQRGGLAEQYQEEQRALAAREAARVSTRGGLAELYAEQAARAQTAVPTVYILESQERAQAVLGGIEQINAFQATQGEPPLLAEVVWLDSAEAEVQFWATHEASRLRDGGSSVASAVIDLRGRSVAPCAAQEAGTPDITRITCS